MITKLCGRNITEDMNSIFDLKHKVSLVGGKRIMTCIEHFCDIDGMTEGEYYKQKREQKAKEKEGVTK